MQFLYGENEQNLNVIGEYQDYTILSDELAQRFNGVYIGMYGTASGKESKNTVEFSWFEYQPSD